MRATNTLAYYSDKKRFYDTDKATKKIKKYFFPKGEHNISRRYDAHYNHTQHNDTQHNDISIKGLYLTPLLSLVSYFIYYYYYYAVSFC